MSFVATAKSGQSLAQAAVDQFASLISQQSAQGYEYYRMDHFSLVEQPGCIGALFGVKPSVLTYDVAVFRRGSPA
ncbi:MAG: hypothetical protein IT384_24740 [Deltaproteobacteria bacterium]|nr:hypothetical protein [Deltaproteobacteria bacterium]